MMSLLTGLILVVVLGAIVQKSDVLLDAFSNLDDGEVEKAIIDSDTVDEPVSEEPVEEVATLDVAPPALEPEPPKVADTAPLPSDPAYRAIVDEVSLEVGGTYLIDVLGNDFGVAPDSYSRLVLLSQPNCGIVRLMNGQVAYHVAEECRGSQFLFYCIDGVDGRQCEEGMLTINVISPVAAKIDPVGAMNDVTPNTDGLARPDRAPAVQASAAAPTISARPSAPQQPGAPLAAPHAALVAPGADQPTDRIATRVNDGGRTGLFAGTEPDANAPNVEATPEQPEEIALLDTETESTPLAGPTRHAEQDGLTRAPIPVAKPNLAERTALEPPKIAGAGALQAPVRADSVAPNGGAAGSPVRVGSASRAELLVRNPNTGPPPNSRGLVTGAIVSPEAVESSGELRVTALSVTGLGDQSATTLPGAIGAPATTFQRFDDRSAVTVNRIARLLGAPESAIANLDRRPGLLQTVSIEREAGAAARRFVLRDRISTGHSAEAVQPLTTFLRDLSSRAPSGLAAGLQELGADDPVTNGRATLPADGSGRSNRQFEVELAATGEAFLLADKSITAIPGREPDPLVAALETAPIQPAGIAHLDQAAAPARTGAAALSNAGAPLQTDTVQFDTALEAQPEAVEEPAIEVAAIAPTAEKVIEPTPHRAPAAPSNCEMSLTVIGARGALIEAEAISPCRAGQIVRFAHHDFEFATRFDADGVASLTIPALSKNATVLARTEDKIEVYARATVPGMRRVMRVALVWSDPLDLNLHAFEYGAGPGDAGHVWADAAPDFPNYKRGRTGLMQAFQPIDGYGDFIEVYSFAPGRRSTAGAVELAIEFASRGVTPKPPYCGGESLASPRYTIMRVENGKLKAGATESAPPAACGQRLSDAALYQRGLVSDVLVRR